MGQKEGIYKSKLSFSVIEANKYLLNFEYPQIQSMEKWKDSKKQEERGNLKLKILEDKRWVGEGNKCSRKEELFTKKIQNYSIESWKVG